MVRLRLARKGVPHGRDREEVKNLAEHWWHGWLTAASGENQDAIRHANEISVSHSCTHLEGGKYRDEEVEIWWGLIWKEAQHCLAGRAMRANTLSTRGLTQRIGRTSPASLLVASSPVIDSSFFVYCVMPVAMLSLIST